MGSDLGAHAAAAGSWSGGRAGGLAQGLRAASLVAALAAAPADLPAPAACPALPSPPRRCCREVSERYPDIEYEEMIVDNTCMQVCGVVWCFAGVLLSRRTEGGGQVWRRHMPAWP